MRKLFTVLSSLLAIATLSGCSNEEHHEHSFSDVWTKDELNHWHEATCEHTHLTSDLAPHNFGDDNICDVCGYELVVSKTHLVYFVSNGGSSVDPIQVKDGEKIYAPRDPLKENYVFLGWYENPEYTGIPYDFDQNIISNVTLYALWGAKISFLNYDGQKYKEVNVRLSSEITEPEDPSWGNAHFLGWYEDRDFVGTTFNFEEGVNKNTTLYARYGYSLEFINIDGETLQSNIHPADKVVEDPGEVTKEHYNFDNWYVDEERTEVFEFGKKLTKDTKIYLKLNPKSYKITYVNAEGLTHANPTSYVYSVGLTSFLEPTAYEYEETKKFYGWYFDEEFKNEATSISPDEAGEITVYAKIGEYHSITYCGWPKSVTNPNSTKITNYDRVDLDGSELEKIDGISNVKFKVGESEVLDIINPTSDVVVDVEFTSIISNVTFDPNGGKILSKTPYILIDGPLQFGSKKVEIDPSKGPFNLYDSSVLDLLISVYGEEGVFKGFYKDNTYSEPLKVYETNYLESGTKVYAKFENVRQTEKEKNLPYRESGQWGEVDPLLNNKEILFYLTVPKGYKTLNISMEVHGSETHSATLINASGFSSPIKSWSGTRDFSIKESVNIQGMSKLTFEYFYNGTKSTFEDYSISFTLGESDNCLVECTPSTKPVSGELSYLKDVEIPYSIVEREYHTFNGWLDKDNNIVDLSSEWLYKDYEMTLKADWVYNGVTEFASKAVNLCREYSKLFEEEGIDFTSADIDKAKSALTMYVLEPYLDKITKEQNLGFEQDLINYNSFKQAAIQEMWELLGDKFISNLTSLHKTYVNSYQDISEELVIKLTEAYEKARTELEGLVYDPEGQIRCYKETKNIFENLISIYIM